MFTDFIAHIRDVTSGRGLSRFVASASQDDLQLAVLLSWGGRPRILGASAGAPLHRLLQRRSQDQDIRDVFDKREAAGNNGSVLLNSPEFLSAPPWRSPAASPHRLEAAGKGDLNKCLLSRSLIVFPVKPLEGSPPHRFNVLTFTAVLCSGTAETRGERKEKRSGKERQKVPDPPPRPKDRNYTRHEAEKPDRKLAALLNNQASSRNGP